MTTDLQDATVGAQETGDLIPKPTGEADVTSSAETTPAQLDGQTSSGDEKLGPDNLPPELEETRKQLLRDYHAKTQKLSEDKLRYEREMEDLKDKSGTLQKLMQQDWFKKAAADEHARRSGNAPERELSDEEWEQARTDKNAFIKLVRTEAERISGKVVPAINDTNSRLKDLQTEREFDRVAGRYKDFKALNDKGALEPYLTKGYDYETAYQKAKWDEIKDLDSYTEQRAQAILNKARDGAVSRPGVPNVRGSRIIEAETFDEAFDKVWSAVSAGEKDVQVRRPKK